MKEQLLKIYAQIKDLFLSMTPGNRIIASLLTATLLVSLGYLLVGSIKTGNTKSKMVDVLDSYVFDNEEKYAAETALRGAGFDEHEWSSGVLRVSANKVNDYTALIGESGALKLKGRERYNAAQDSSPWESAKMMDEKKITAKEIDLANAIKRLSGIDEATVNSHLRLDRHNKVWVREEKYSVGVNVKATYNKPLEDNTISAIGILTAKAFGITDLKEISIVDDNNHTAYYGNGAEVSGGGAGDYMKHQKRYQEEWKARIYELLPNIPGLKVDAEVTLTDYINKSEFGVTHGKPTILAEHVKGSDYDSVGWDRFGRPGQVAQLSRPLIDPENGIDGRARTKETRHEEERNNALQGVEERLETVPFIPLKVLTTLQIPKDYVRNVWLEENAAGGVEPVEPTPEELAAKQEELTQYFKESVSQLLLFYWDKKTTPDVLDMVRVSYYPTIREKVPELTAWQKTQQWLAQNWESVVLAGLVLCGLGVLWMIANPAKPEPIVIYEAPEIPMEVIEARAQAKAEAEAAARAAEEDEEGEMQRTLDGFDKAIRSLQDEIAELIEENPEAAAAVIRQWIGNAVLVEKQG